MWFNAFRYDHRTYCGAVWRSSPATDDTRLGPTARELDELIAVAETQGRLVQSIVAYEVDEGTRFTATW